jgi:hypothetical protein
MLTAPFPHPWKDNPEGCQRVAGGRSGKRGNDHRNSASEGPAPWRGARRSYQTTPRPRIPGHLNSWRVTGSGAMPISSPHGSNESGTPPGCRSSAAPLTGGRRPEKPSATSGYPLATLQVDRSILSKLESPPKEERDSALGFRPSFGLRASAFGLRKRRGTERPLY